MPTHYWLFKSEPETFGIQHLAKRPKQTEPWNGVRNFQVRNMLKNEIKVGDLGFFYHSSCTPPGIAGIIEVVKEGYPDPTARDPESQYYDPLSTKEKPRWYMVDVKLVKIFKRFITLEELKQQHALENMVVCRRGSRLSISPVTAKEWDFILKLEKKG